MPELPDITVYVEAMERRIVGETLGARAHPEPVPAPDVRAAHRGDARQDGPRGPPARQADRHRARRETSGSSLHLMIAGRLHWKPPGAKLSGKGHLAALRFPGRIAAAHRGRHEAPGVALGAPRPRRLEGARPGRPRSRIGHARRIPRRARPREPHAQARPGRPARLQRDRQRLLRRDPPPRPTLSAPPDAQALTTNKSPRLFAATRDVLREWTARLRAETGDGFPEGVTAFRPEMAVHGRFGEPCPVCAAPVQRIRYADRETNYCPRCQTGGKILADRSLSRLLKDDWPRHLDEL